MSRCNQCGKRADRLGSYATQLGNIVLCSDCYEGLDRLRACRRRPFKSMAQLESAQREVDEQMDVQNMKEDVKQGINSWFKSEKIQFISQEKLAEINAQTDAFMMTTGYAFEGYAITEYHGVISGESVLGTGFLSSWDASWSDTFGVESEAFINKLKEARNAAKQRAIKATVETGGNAIIGVDFDYTMFTSNLIGVIVNGTSVTIEKTGKSVNQM